MDEQFTDRTLRRILNEIDKCKTSDNDGNSVMSFNLVKHYIEKCYKQGLKNGKYVTRIVPTLKGDGCPCCGQYVKLYKRNMSSSMVTVFVFMYRWFKRKPDEEWMNVGHEIINAKFPVPIRRGGTFTFLKHWKFIVQKPGTNKEGTSKESGMWKLTDKGKSFIEKKITAPSCVYVFNDKLYYFGDKMINIDEAFKIKFNYKQMMAGEYD